MELLIVVFSVLLSMGISLGVGSSTLAVLNFFHAIADGTISETERNFMGVTYILLRVAMGLILFSGLFLTMIGYGVDGFEYFTGYISAQLLLTIILFVNAILMTLHIMPSTFGPAIQASSWYSLGFMMALLPLGLTNFRFIVFLLCYATLIIFAVSLINGIMGYLKDKLLVEKEQGVSTT